MTSLTLHTIRSKALSFTNHVTCSSIQGVIGLREWLALELLEWLETAAVDVASQTFASESQEDVREELKEQKDRQEMEREEVRCRAVWAELHMIAEERKRAAAARKHVAPKPVHAILVPKGSGRWRTRMFLEHQTKRMEAVDYLINRSGKALILIMRHAAHAYLRGRADEALSRLDRGNISILNNDKAEELDHISSIGKSINENNTNSVIPFNKRRLQDIARQGSSGSLSRRRKISNSQNDTCPKEWALSSLIRDIEGRMPHGHTFLNHMAKKDKNKLLHHEHHESGKKPTDALSSPEELLRMLGVSSGRRLEPQDLPPESYASLSQVSEECALLIPSKRFDDASAIIAPVKRITKRNPVRFLTAVDDKTGGSGGDTSYGYHESMEDYRRIGYSSGRTEFMTLW
eukprot:CAMPEP_0182439646 /NCGR_PEP_ID=MMETSP1167-20130531/86561_1 /TAXON_ID=2988 /ORGANISM="Mallomonas Sp, Strain CCMP3275" /LENGTH=403 /DNA_ID=CAMNT_0024633389 /DNA_START=1080 /DNA_END=2288 /DNA_ORIENTATION=-